MKLYVSDIEIKDLKWDSRNMAHIKKHDLSPRQVEQVFIQGVYFAAEGKKGKLLVHGRCGRRLLTVVLAPEHGSYYVITARDMSRKERRRYYEIYENEDHQKE